MKWRAYLALGRPSNLPTVWTNTAAGTILADPGAPFDAARTAVMMMALSLLYTGGMFLNDAFDRDYDARERPERPIPSGKVSARKAFAIGLGMLAIGVVLVAVRAGGLAALISGGLAAAILVYDAWHKRNPIAPFIMGGCRALVYLAAGAAVAGEVRSPVLIAAGVLLSYVIGLTYVARQENLASFRGFWPLIFLSAPFIYSAHDFWCGCTGWIARGIFLGFLGWVAWAISLLLRRRPGTIGRAVISLIAGISLLDALIVTGEGRPTAALALTAGFFATLFLQRYVRGT